MNITDIDDKIIKRARQEYLFKKYTSSKLSPEKILEDCKNVLTVSTENTKLINDPDKKNMLENMIIKMSKAVDMFENVIKNNKSNEIDEALNVLFKEGRDPISDWLDKKDGHTVSEHSIFSSVPKYWEAAFHSDMDALNVSFF